MSVRTGRAFAAERGLLPEIRRFVASEAGRLSFAAFAADLQLAVTEACSNAILHTTTEEIRVFVATVGSCIEVTVEDDGVYRQSIPAPEVDGTGHRGLHLMAATMDDLSLRRGTRARPGTVVHLVKCKP